MLFPNLSASAVFILALVVTPTAVLILTRQAGSADPSSNGALWLVATVLVLVASVFLATAAMTRLENDVLTIVVPFAALGLCMRGFSFAYEI